MAGKSLGVLTLDLVARIGGFTQGMDSAARTADKKSKEIAAAAARARKQAEKEFGALGNAIKAGIAGITVVGLFSKFISETRAYQNEQAQLAATLKSTGAAAGYNHAELAKMSEGIAEASSFSAGEI